MDAIAQPVDHETAWGTEMGETYTDGCPLNRDCTLWTGECFYGDSCELFNRFFSGGSHGCNS